MIPTHWNFANLQTGPMRAIKQLHIEREAFDLRFFKNRPARLETKRFKSTLSVPKWQPCGGPDQQIENTAALLAPPRLMHADQARSKAREPNAMSTSPFAMGSISFGVSSSGVERSASENSPIGVRAASNPDRTAAPFPRFGKFSSKRVVTGADFNLSRAITPVPSVDPSFTTINSLSGALAAR